MKIYHYTSVDNLVLILKNRTIRFNRLDRMDDPCECSFFSTRLNWSPYTYVSCWTETEKANLSLWHMYAKNGIGVRIGLEKECIDWEKVESEGLRTTESRFWLPPMEDGANCLRALQYSPFTIFGGLGVGECYHPITYLEENHLENQEVKIGYRHTVIKKTLTEDDFKIYIGLFKDKKWEFQNETRFRIFGVPVNAKEGKLTFETFQNTIENQVYNPYLFIDLPLKEDALDNLEIIVGPNAAESTELLVKACIKEYAKNATIRRSF